MNRVLCSAVLLAAMTSLSACSDSSDSDSSKDARCTSAEKAVSGAKTFERKLVDQDPDVTMERFFSDLARGKVGAALGLADTQQKVHQLISDSPTCFSVVEVADARRALNILNPAMAEATRLSLADAARAD